MANVEPGTLLWTPSTSFREQSRLADYLRWLERERGLAFADYAELWHWSVTDLEDFWSSIVAHFNLPFSRPWQRVLSGRTMPGARWFEGAELNYAEMLFRQETAGRPALLYASELRPPRELSWADLRSQVAAVAAGLRTLGVGRGDRVVAYLPNLPEATIAFLACASLGAIWSSCAPEFGIRSVIDRFAQIEPRVLFAVDGYVYDGKSFDRRTVVEELRRQLPSLETTVLVPNLYPAADATPAGTRSWSELVSGPAGTLEFASVPFDHPLWVLYSSGTTGLPKAIVHGHGGVVVEHVKSHALHTNIKPGDHVFWYTSTGWMMWNFLVGMMLAGGVPVLYDGHPGPGRLWELAEQAGVTLFGTSAAYLMSCLKAGLRPGAQHDLSRLESIGSTGSPLPPEGFGWVYEQVKPDVWLNSMSGGTDIVGGLVGGCPLLPVYAGEIQCRALGAKVEAFDERGRSVINQLGELVVTEPMPSMPLFLWNDPDGRRYRESYFETYPGVWRHGDWIEITERGTSIISGRSDSTLNRQGVRMGTSEIYSVVEGLPEVADSLVVGLELPGGAYQMLLFVQLAQGEALEAGLEARLKAALRTTLSPRHVPDRILSVPAIPRTLTGKKMEVPVKKLLQGVPLNAAASPGATTDPRALEYFAALAKEMKPPRPAAG